MIMKNEASVAHIFRDALAAVDPSRAVLNALSVENNCLKIEGVSYDLAAFDRILIVGAGKAAASMAEAVEGLLGSKISAGLILVKDSLPLSLIEQVVASHPLPDQAGIAGTQRILQMLEQAGKETLIICLLSGGASSLMVSPVAGVTLQDKQTVTLMLQNAGASIAELNAVRKHLSNVKGGKLAQRAYPALLLTLILSDVIGDPLDVIASGPTAPDRSTFKDAWAVIVKYSLQSGLPPAVADYLQRGMTGELPETVKFADPCFENVQNAIIANIHLALNAAARCRFNTQILTASLQGEAREAANFLAQTVRARLSEMGTGEQCCLLAGGETTVTVRGQGRGGRNQELALAFALAIEGLEGVSLLSAGTDGGDGPTDAAGAMVDGTTAIRARSMGMEPLDFLNDNDSYTFFQRFDAMSGMQSHFKTGSTGTNVMDMQIVLLDKRALAV